MISELERVYRQYNRKYFAGKLPQPPEIVLRWKRMNALIAYQEGDEIVVNSRFRRWNSIWESALLHEMVHLELPAAVVHGKKFQDRMLQLAKAGAMKGLW